MWRGQWRFSAASRGEATLGGKSVALRDRSIDKLYDSGGRFIKKLWKLVGHEKSNW